MRQELKWWELTTTDIVHFGQATMLASNKWKPVFLDSTLFIISVTFSSGPQYQLKNNNNANGAIRSAQVLYLPSWGQYMTVSQGGFAGLRDCGDMSLVSSQRLQNSTVQPKDLWVTDVVLLQNVHKVIAAQPPKPIPKLTFYAKQFGKTAFAQGYYPKFITCLISFSLDRVKLFVSNKQT